MNLASICRKLALASLLLPFACPLLAEGEGDTALVVPVENGIHRVQVEVWDAGESRWVPYSVAHLKGLAGWVKLRAPAAIEPGRIRVRAHPRALVPPGWIDDEMTVHADRTTIDESTASRGGVGVPTYYTAGVEVDNVRNDDAVVESDIWKLAGETLYFFNQLRGLQVIDLSDPAQPLVTGRLRYPARGDQMYQLSADYVLLLARAAQGTTRVELVRLRDGDPYIAQSFADLPGAYLDSRMVGDRLYVVTEFSRQETGTDGQSEWRGATVVTGIDFSDPSAPVELGALEIERSLGWGNTVTATNDTLILTTNHYVYENEDGDWWERGWHHRSQVYLVDLTTDDGVPAIAASAPVSGRVLDKFNLRLRDGVLTTIAQAQGYRIETYTTEIPNDPGSPPSSPPSAPPEGAPGDPPAGTPGLGATSGDGSGTTTVTRTRRVWYRNTVLETFRLDGSALTPAGSVELAAGESLRATRFDGDRAYIVTFRQVDPLFVVDLADPDSPSIVGELEVPGWSSYLQVLPDGHLFSIGVEDRRVALSLFDVADPASMSLLSRVYLSPEGTYSWSEGNYEEKAISLFPDEGLALVPFRAYHLQDGLYTHEMALQVVELAGDQLVLRGKLPSSTTPRRASLLGGDGDAIVSISERLLSTASLADPDAPAVLADQLLAWDVNRVFVVGDALLQLDSTSTGYAVSSADSDRLILRVSPSDRPDEILGEFSLPGGWVVGSALRGGRLFLLFKDYAYDWSKDEVLLSRYRLETIDVSDPLAPVTGAAAVYPFEFSRYSYSNTDLGPAWIDGDKLVWLPREQATYYPFFALDAAWGAIPGYYRSFDFWLPLGSPEAQVLVTDVSDPAHPKFIDGLDLTRPLDQGSVAYSDAMLAGRKIVLTESAYWWKSIKEPDPDRPTGWTYRYENHRENHLLSVPIGDDGSLGNVFRADLPGTLTGVVPLDDAASIVISHERVTTPATGETDPATIHSVFHAHLFDGTQLLPLDRLGLPPDQVWSDYQLSLAFADRVAYRTGHDYAPFLTVESTIDRVRFGEDGQFAELAPLSTPNTPSTQLDVLHGDHLVARSDTATLVWSLSGDEPALLGRFDPPTQSTWWGWGWDTPGEPVLAPGDALWIPAGPYGVDRFELPPAAEPIAAATVLATRSAEADWSSIPLDQCTPTTLAGTDAVGAIGELRWRFKGRDFATPDPAADDYGDYWYQSAWYGWYHQSGESHWLYHLHHGWVWAEPGPVGTWLYDSKLGWTWTSARNYPYLYSSSRQSWLFFARSFSKKGTRWFYDDNPADEGWFSVPKG